MNLKETIPTLISNPEVTPNPEAQTAGAETEASVASSSPCATAKNERAVT
jgi:hypothetical protein